MFKTGNLFGVGAIVRLSHFLSDESNMAELFSYKFVRSIDANRTVKDALITAMTASRPRTRISVTDLVNPMQAFHKRMHPEIQPSIDRQQIMMAGTGFHDIFGKLVSTEEYLEQLLEMDGIVGKVDIFEDVPIELKTTSSIPADIYAGRTSYFEQLAMYCAMAGNDTGRLIVYQRHADNRPPKIKVFEVEFKTLGKVAVEMKSRSRTFKLALDRKTPAELTQCEWLYRGCDYSGICPCRDLQPAEPMLARDDMVITAKPEIESNLKNILSVPIVVDTNIKLKDLVLPRKFANYRKPISENGTENDSLRPMQDIERQGFRFALQNALESGSSGDFTAQPISLPPLEDKVNLHRGIPTVLRTSSFREMVDRDRLVSTFPHYFDRLAFECALANIRQGRLILYYEKIPRDKFMVYDLTFHSRDLIVQEAARRIELLEQGVEQKELPNCPSWMAKYCEFESSCQCGEQ